MSRISFFQRYSQRENHATNNLLLAFRYVYESSPRRLQRVLQSLLPEFDFQIGLSFAQQQPEIFSTPDAVITQARLRFFIETKTRGELEQNQIMRHIDSIATTAAASESVVLLGLSPKRPDATLIENCKKYALKKKIQFEAVTFAELLQSLDEEFKEYETAERAVIEDLQDYLQDEGLFPNDASKLFAALCSQTYEQNLQDKVYYEPAYRSSKGSYGFLGLYKDRSVRAIGRIRKAVELDLITPDAKLKNLSGEDRETIIRVIKNSPYPDLGSSSHRYYLVDEFIETDYKKDSKYGLRKGRTFNLIEKIGPEVATMSVAQIAERLRKLHWE